MLLCAASIFLPFFLCWAAIPAALICALFRGKSPRVFVPAHSGWFYSTLALGLAAGLYYRHFLGLVTLAFVAVAFLFGLWARFEMTERLRSGIIVILSFGSLFAAAAAFIQKFPAPSFRSVSFFYNANYYAYVCELSLLALFYAILRKPVLRKSVPRGLSFFYFAAIAADVGGIVASGCRSAWLAVFFGMLVILRCLKKHRAFIAAALAGLVAAAAVFLLPRFLFPRLDTFTSDKNLRFLIWRTAFGFFKSHPIFGQGMFTYFLESTGRAHDTHAHDLILDVLVDFGVVGLALLTVFAVFAVRGLLRRLRRDALQGPACALALAVLMASFVHGVTDVPFVGPQCGPLLILLVAFAGGGARKASDKNNIDDEGSHIPVNEESPNAPKD